MHIFTVAFELLSYNKLNTTYKENLFSKNESYCLAPVHYPTMSLVTHHTGSLLILGNMSKNEI